MGDATSGDNSEFLHAWSGNESPAQRTRSLLRFHAPARPSPRAQLGSTTRCHRGAPHPRRPPRLTCCTPDTPCGWSPCRSGSGCNPPTGPWWLWPPRWRARGPRPARAGRHWRPARSWAARWTRSRRWPGGGTARRGSWAGRRAPCTWWSWGGCWPGPPSWTCPPRPQVAASWSAPAASCSPSSSSASSSSASPSPPAAPGALPLLLPCPGTSLPPSSRPGPGAAGSSHRQPRP